MGPFLIAIVLSVIIAAANIGYSLPRAFPAITPQIDFVYAKTAALHPVKSSPVDKDRRAVAEPQSIPLILWWAGDAASGVIGHPKKPTVVTEARLSFAAARWVGKGPREIGTRSTLWCAAFINKVLKGMGMRGTGSDLAASFARYGKPSKMKPGAIAVKRRRGGNHVVVIERVLKDGRVVAISGNSGNRVRRMVYRASVFWAVRTPA